MNQLNIVGHEESFRALDPILLTVFYFFVFNLISDGVSSYLFMLFSLLHFFEEILSTFFRKFDFSSTLSLIVFFQK